MKFPKGFLIDLLDDRTNIVRDEPWDHSRWCIIYELIFKHKGKFYRTNYRKAATEIQDEQPWEYETEVECEEVVESLVPGYVPLGSRIVRPRI